MKANIKEQNYWMIKDFAIDRSRRPEMQGNKLISLYRLIQIKGEPIKSNDEKINGVKALQISENEYIGMIKTSFKKDCFFPCKLKTILLTNL